MTDATRLDGRTAIVTGGAGGIGRAIVVALARRGARCRIADRVEPAAAIAALAGAGVAAEGGICDVTVSAEVDRFVRRAEAELGGIDVLVNCAGGGQRVGFVETTDEDWFAQINANLTGAFFMMRAALPGMLARGGGAVVNVASISGIIGGLPSRGTMGRSGPAYGAAKAGLIGLTKWAAREFGSQGVRVNAIAPGPVVTNETMVGYDYGVEDYPIPRMGLPDDMAEAVAFLASPAASYITGEVIKVAGGVGM
jgi:3-oxoacyl-[acyl-carrier protein] reductase